MDDGKYTDVELRDATQIAYLQLESGLERMGYSIDDGIPEPISIGEILDNIEVGSTEYEENKDKISIMDSDGTDWRSWKIVDINDKNSTSGLYNCIIDTGDNNAIVAFRGSESMTKDNLIKDWWSNDLQLITGHQTTQEADVDEYIKKLLSKGILSDYDSIYSTGHSLGGNLSDYFAVEATNYPEIWEKYEGGINFDGPGFSNEFIDEHAEEISIAASKLRRYKWSIVSSALLSLPGEEEVYLKTKDYDGDSSLGETMWNVIFKHDTKSLIFDEEGKAVRGTGDLLQKGIQYITKFLANYTSQSFREDLGVQGVLIVNVLLSGLIVIGLEFISIELKNYIENVLQQTFNTVAAVAELGVGAVEDALGYITTGGAAIANFIVENAAPIISNFYSDIISVGTTCAGAISAIGAWGINVVSDGLSWTWNTVGSIGSSVLGAMGWNRSDIRIPANSYGDGTASGNIQINVDAVMNATDKLWNSFVITDACFSALSLVESVLNMLNPFGWFSPVRENLKYAHQAVEIVNQDIYDLIGSVERSVDNYYLVESALVRSMSSFL